MRLGKYPCKIAEGSNMKEAYKTELIEFTLPSNKSIISKNVRTRYILYK